MENIAPDNSAELTNQNLITDISAHQNPIEENIRHSARVETCTGFQIANWEKAKAEKQANSNRIFKGKQVSMFAPLPHFKIYGNGIFLFFSFLWSAIVCFIVISLLSLIQIIYNSTNGNAFEYRESSFSVQIAETSIGNNKYQLLTGTDTESVSKNHKVLNVVMDLVTCAVFIIFIFIWEKKSEDIEKDISKSIKLSSEKTLEMVSFPPTANPNNVEQFMSQFGPVAEVAPVRDYSEKIMLSKKIYETELQIKQIQLCTSVETCEKDDEAISKLQKEKEKYERELEKEEELIDSNYLKFYIVFEEEADRDKVFSLFEPYQPTFSCLSPEPPENCLLDRGRVTLQKCQTEPAGIIWENVHVTWHTRWVRALLQGVIILIIITGGFVSISLLNIAAANRDSNLDTSQYSWETIQSERNQNVVYSWCIKNISYTGSSPYSSFCSSYWQEYKTMIFLGVMISIVIVAFKSILNLAVVRIAKFQRYSDHTEQSKAIMKNLFIIYMSTTVLITFLMQAKIFNISIKSFFLKLTNNPVMIANIKSLTEYSDIEPEWYEDIGYQIWLNMLIDAFLMHCFIPIIRKALGCFGEWRGRKERLHKKMMDAIACPDFEIQEHYAEILMAISIGIIFGGGMPIFLPVVLLGLATRYIFLKIDFIKYCKIPKPFGSSLNEKALQIIKGSVIARGVLSIYMFGATSVFAPENSDIVSWNESFDIAIVNEVMQALSRFALTWYYSVFLGVFIVAFILRALIVNVCLRNCMREDKMDEQNPQEAAMRENMRSMGEISQKTLAKSYKLENNPEYLEILAIMKMKARKERNKERLSKVTPQQ